MHDHDPSLLINILRETMNARHLTTDEKQTLAVLVDACGPAEVLRVLATLTANVRDYDEVGDRARSEMFAIAKRIDPNHNGERKPARHA